MTSSTVLIVEDDRVLRLSLKRQLQAAGYDVVLAEDAIQALSAARAKLPDLILLDLGLPGGGGISVLERLDRLQPLSAIPVVVYTGGDRATVEPTIEQFAVAGFLAKPATNEELLQTVRQALNGS